MATPYRTDYELAQIGARQLKPGEEATVFRADGTEAFHVKRTRDGTFPTRLTPETAHILAAAARPAPSAPARPPARPAPAPQPIRRSATTAPDAAASLAELRRAVGAVVDALSAKPPASGFDDMQRNALQRLAALAGFSISFTPAQDAASFQREPLPADGIAKRAQTPAYGDGMFANIVLPQPRRR